MRTFLMMLVMAVVIRGEWSDNPGNPLTLGSGIQPQIARTSDGGTYVAWLTQGSFHIYLQRLDANGNPLLNPGGMLVSNAPNSSWIAVYHMNLAVDQEDNAIISSVDTRTGNWQVYIYKVSPAGNQLWGANGLALSNSAGDNISPRLLVEPSDNSVVVSWSDNFTSLRLQRIGQDGQLLWGNNGIAVSSLNASLVSPQPVRCSDGTILVQAIRQTGSFPALTSQITQKKYALSGNPIWPAWVSLGTPASFPLGNWLQDAAPGAEGEAYTSWTELTSQNQTGMLQKMDADGLAGWVSPLELSTAESHFRVSPQITIPDNFSGVYAVWAESDANQNNRGIYAQRVDSSGLRQWGDTGLAVESLGPSVYMDIQVSVLNNDLLTVYTENTNTGNSDIFASRLDPNGSSVWEDERVTVTNSGMDKEDLFMSKGSDCAFLVWSEAGSIKAHCLLAGGMLGIPAQSGSLLQVPEDYPTIQGAIDVAENGDTVLVEPGTYVELINFSGKDIVVGSRFLTTGDTSYIAETILDGGRGGTIVTFNSNEGPDAELIGFTLQHGSASFSDPDGDGDSSSYGGGIYCYNSSPVLRHLILSNNWDLGGGGGGLFCYGSSPRIESVSFDGNITGDVGGAIYAKANCIISIKNSSFTNNSCPSVGAAIYARDSTVLVLDRVLMVNNNSDHAGGGIGLKAGCEAILTNVTISENFALHHGAGLYSNSSRFAVVNSILWANDGGEVYFADFDDPSEIILAYSTVQDSSAGITSNDNGTVLWLEGNLDQDPVFSDTSRTDYSLSLHSPCLDAGLKLFVLNGDTLLDIPDRDIVGSAPDMGVFELTPEIVNYFPLTVWSGYMLASDVDTTTIIVVDSIMIGSELYYVFDAWYPGENINPFRVDGNQVKVWTGTNEAVLYDIAVPLNASWEFLNAGMWDSQITLISIGDTIETPMGVYENCYCFHRFIGNDYEYYDWLAQDGGLVQRDVITFAGSRRYTLISHLVPVATEDDTRIMTSQDFRLRQNYPNPFNPSTTISYFLPASADVKVTIFDVTGAEVRFLQNDHQEAGLYILEWSGINQQGGNLDAGVYFCQVKGPGFSETIKMIYLK